MAEDKKTEPYIFDEQGILLSNIIDLTNGRSEKGISDSFGPTDPQQAVSTYKKYLSLTNEPGLSNVCLIDTKNPSTFLNILKGDSKRNDILLKLSTFELSSLVPVIRVFKVFYDSITDNEIVLELPFETTAKGIDTIFETSMGRGSGAGITSVEWKQNPKNEANLSTFKVNLNLHLQNVEEFFKTKNSITLSDGKEYNVQLQDLLYQRKEWRKENNEGSAVYDPDKYVLKMVVGWQADDSILERIKEHSNRNPEETQLLIDALRDQKEVFYLTFVSHTIEFNEDGSLDLQINYFARSDMNMDNINKSNIMNLGTAYESLISNIKKEIDLVKKQNTEFTQQVDKDKLQREKEDKESFLPSFNFESESESSLKANNEKLKELEEKLKEVEGNAKRRKFNNITTRMLERGHIHLFSYDVELVKLISNLKGKFNLSSVTDIKNVREYISSTIEAKSRHESELRKKSIATGGRGNISNIGELDKTTLSHELKEKMAASALKAENPTESDNLNQIKADIRLAAEQASGEDPDDIIKSNNELYELLLEGKTAKNALVERHGRKHFAFFYLSSLIDAVLEPIMNTNKFAPNFINKKTRVILGPMTIIDYGSLVSDGRTYKIFDSIEAEREDKPTYVKVFTGKPIIINIGDIPISLKDFANWFNENYINKNKEQVTFNEFISDLVNNLIITSINSQAYPFAPRQKAKFAIDSFTSIAGLKNESVFVNNLLQYKRYKKQKMNPGAGGFRVAQEKLESLKTKSKDIDKDQDPSADFYLPNKDYIVVYCINDSPYERVGDYEVDKKDGILHLYANESRGTLRNIKFSRVDNANRRADNILAESGTGRGVSKIIREKYNVSIEMFGNTCIQAGTYIFLKPTYSSQSGVNNTEKLLRDLGLGGYYMVTEVSNNIEIGDFRTSIRGTWSAFADGNMNDGEREYSSPPPGIEPSKGVVK